MGLNVYVHGPRGIGRTSFLRQIERDSPEARYARLFGFETLTERLDEVERRLTNQVVLRRQQTPLLHRRSNPSLARQTW